MIKRPITPLVKEKTFARNLSNQRIFKDIKNTLPTRQQTYTRNPSNSKLTITQHHNIQNNRGVNPESPPILKQIRSTIPVINEDIRKIVIQWLLQISHSLKPQLRRQTVFMGIHIFDLVIPKLKDVSNRNIQLIATTSLFIAAKYEEIYPESLQKFLEYSENSYGKQQLLQMQEKILGCVQFKLTFSTRFTHLGIFLSENNYIPDNRHAAAKKFYSLSLFFLELSLFVKWQDYQQAQIAQASLFLASKVLKMGTKWVNDTVMEIAFKLKDIWRQNYNSLLAYLFDNDNYSFVGGLKLIY